MRIRKKTLTGIRQPVLNKSKFLDLPPKPNISRLYRFERICPGWVSNLLPLHSNQTKFHYATPQVFCESERDAKDCRKWNLSRKKCKKVSFIEHTKPFWCAIFFVRSDWTIFEENLTRFEFFLKFLIQLWSFNHVHWLSDDLMNTQGKKKEI